MPFCDPTLPIDKRVQDIISRLPLAMKINLTSATWPHPSTSWPDIPSIGLASYLWQNEATHGLKDRNATNFPLPLTMAMSFNRTLWWKVGSQIGHEARAFGEWGVTLWTPVINLARDPRWGRNLECPGEDPYLTGEFATQFVKGAQEAPEDPYHLLQSATCKHFVGNEMEGWSQQERHWGQTSFSATITAQDLVDTYLMPFQTCVEVGRASGLMCSYNAVNGIPSCANHWLITEVARGEWGFDGYVTSDCDADQTVWADHHYTETPEEAVQLVLRAGTDIDCGVFVMNHAKSALDKGYITEGDIDTRLAYLFRLLIRLGHFDPIGPLNLISTDVICSSYSQALARDGTTQSCALLKNIDNRLPLDSSRKESVAVIGPNGALSKETAGSYGPNSNCGHPFWTLVDAIGQYTTNVNLTLGLKNVSTNDTSGIPGAALVAKAADIVVLAVGTDLTMGGEGRDAKSIEFTPAQTQLMRAVISAAKSQVIIVVFTHFPLDISEFLQNPKVGAILHVGQPSVQTLGIGDLLYGKRVPAGRMDQTIYPASYGKEVSILDFNMRPGPSNFPRPDCTLPFAECPNGTNPGRTHRFYTGKAVIPFGFGLSYTTFSYKIVESPKMVTLGKVRQLLAESAAQKRNFPKMESLRAPMVEYQVNVTNTGNYDADDAVLGFVIPPNAGQDGIPLQSLFGFERVHVKKGETVTVFLYPSVVDFTYVDTNGARVPLVGEYKFQFGVPETQVASQGFTVHSVYAS